MPRYRLDKNTRELVEITEAAKVQKSPQVWRDIPEYQSPLGNWTVDGRAQRREELKRYGCREIDPSEKSQIDRITETGRKMRGEK
ncbi:MAG: hypothetical protein QNJ62_05150 [Methyloceanibacter sp.]|nr:hypothetical protein [Methyloceanibacter sp.]